MEVRKLTFLKAGFSFINNLYGCFMKTIGQRIKHNNEIQKSKIDEIMRIRLRNFFDKALNNAEEHAKGKRYRRPCLSSKIHIWPFDFWCLSDDVSAMASEEGEFAKEWMFFKSECDAADLTPILEKRYGRFEITFNEIQE